MFLVVLLYFTEEMIEYCDVFEFGGLLRFQEYILVNDEFIFLCRFYGFMLWDYIM